MNAISFSDNHVLGRFNGDAAPAQSEELKAAYQRIAELTAELNECRGYFEERADADCDQDGFIPNDEMKRMISIDECLHGPGNF